jgi:glutamine---fructose-6-phosphate transaminase (isomerizing)
MCGIVGYVGKGLSWEPVKQGLARLEYRGYDSAGFACIHEHDGSLRCVKAPGYLANLEAQFDADPINGRVGMGHIRWSSHGVVSYDNAHPLFDCSKKISIVHNGIIENDYELRCSLQRAGHIFLTQTDTETVAHLLEETLAKGLSLPETLSCVVNQLQGAYALVILLQEYPDQLLIIRKGSPLCVGLGDHEYFVASDQIAFVDHVQSVMFLPEESFGIVSSQGITLYRFSGEPLVMAWQPVDKEITTWLSEGKGGFAHFMLKEIYEQKGAIQQSLQVYREKGDEIWDQMGLDLDQVKNLESITLVGSGTSWHAAHVSQFFFEEIARMSTAVHLASEFRYRPFFPQKNSLYMIISQSGETADTLEALRLMNADKVPTVALTNVASSTAVREAGGFLLTYAGQEVAVASTKTFTTQIAVLFMLAHRLAVAKGFMSLQQGAAADQQLLLAGEILENMINNYKQEIIERLAPFYARFQKFIFLGRHMSYPFAMEAALKLKEISYIFAQCYPAGELKHGSLALIDETIAVVVFSSLDPLIYQKLLSNVQEVKVRNGHIVAFVYEGQEALIALADTCFVVPRVHPLLGVVATVGLMQFFVYQIAKELDRPIDKPRNLAKTLTIE